MLPGPNEERSVANPYKWLHDVAMSIGLGHSLAVAFHIPGVFHHLYKNEEQKLRHHLGKICEQWHAECIAGNMSAGFVVEINGGSGTAKGTLSVVSVGLGPFMCLL